jgi:hypothetical protein
MNRSWNIRPTASSYAATTVAEGTPLPTSSAWFGPESPARRARLPNTSSSTSVMRRSVSFSTPFERITTGTSAPRWACIAVAVSRTPRLGVTMTTAPAPESASLMSDVALTLPGRVISRM